MSTLIQLDNLLASQLMWFGELKVSQKGAYDADHHGNFLEINAVMEGAVTIRSEQGETELTAGQTQLCFHQSPPTYEFKTDQDSHTCWLGVLVPPEADFPTTLFETLPVTLPSWERLITLLHVGAEVEHHKGGTKERAQHLLGEAIFNEFFDQADIFSDQPPLPDAVMKAKHQIENDYLEPLDMDALSNTAGMHKQHLAKKFKAHLGITPREYLWQLRAQKGQTMLLTTAMTIAQISDHCGYANQFHFSKHIKKHYNQSPTALRKQKNSKT